MSPSTIDADCPECAADVALSADVFQHEIVPCPDCGLELEVLEIEPPELTPAPEVEEDWGE